MPITIRELKVGDRLLDTELGETYTVVKMTDKKLKVVTATLLSKDGLSHYISAERNELFKEYNKIINNKLLKK
jgi:hypothetical protein